MLSAATAALPADPPSVKLALSFRPVQKTVTYETPKVSEYDKCKVQVERQGKTSGWVVFGPSGQVLRRFGDTNGDNVVDHWRYYRHGLEVYRDIDTNFNNKVDQSRWLNSGGSRWGLDRDEDGRIDEWKVISAEEASAEAVRALTSGDVRTLKPLLVNADDLKSLRVAGELRKKILESVDSPAAKLRSAPANSAGVTARTKWVRFNASSPGVVPADEGKAEFDLTVYENAMAIVETDGKSGLVQIGEMLRVGNAWKLTQVPFSVGANVRVTAGGLLMQPIVAAATIPRGATGGLSPKMQKLLAELQELDRKAPKPSDGTKAFARYNRSRAELIEKLIAASDTQADRDQWRKQLVDGVAAAVQSGLDPDGLKKLQSIEADVRRRNPRSRVLPYATFRRMVAEYAVRLQNASAGKRADVQAWWLKELEGFAGKYPSAEDAPEAMLQLGITLEFGNKVKDARGWYSKAVAADGKSSAGRRAAGALKRLNLVGKVLELSGPSLSGGVIDVTRYRGKVLLVIFWSTWCKPCTEDLPQLKSLYAKYRASGFEIVGVNLDVDAGPAKPYIARHGVSWPHIHQAGGLDSPPARQYGIISLPTMFLTDRKGKVISRATSVDDLKKTLPTLLKAR
ncbi:MAG: redoxin domain-containing protein [Planctomycetaceae bacterium]